MSSPPNPQTHHMTRTKFIRARVTAEEYAQAELNAKDTGRKLSEYVRERCVYEPKMKATLTSDKP